MARSATQLSQHKGVLQYVRWLGNAKLGHVKWVGWRGMGWGGVGWGGDLRPGEMACTARATARSTCSATELAAVVMRCEASGLSIAC